MTAADDYSRKLDQTTGAQRLQMWIEVMDACDAFLLDGLKAEVGEENVPVAYRAWYRRTMEDHDRMMLHMMQEFARRQGPRTGPTP
jgi:hypothetical protein